ncbi:MAG TPA: bifunctional anthranilate synthase component II/anthranilate phosphoribosyltransferase [Spirochaetia bacterium]|nr:bifunctional anthranilate synthase component II/anthranilate phosphoribosyltransferase [Spirochaetia bacterium]
MYVIIDNYDSFTYNLYQYLSEITKKQITVYRNDEVDLSVLEHNPPEAIIISPGPGTPDDAGISVPLIKRFAGKIPILGVCLGHQSIAAAFGARIAGAKRIVHGKAEQMSLDGKGLFRTLPARAVFTRYHSLSVAADTLPEEFEITARADDGEIMGIRHKTFVLEGVQFHPESIASEHGKAILQNFLHYKREPFPVKVTLSRLMMGEDLSMEEADGFMEELTDGNLNTSEIAAFLTALNIKGYTPDEIAGCAAVLKRKKVPIAHKGPVLDTCGTGGDGLHTFNISSLAALIAASCGVSVAKHGNRAVSSACGSADFYTELGISIDFSSVHAESLLAETGFTFLFAPLYHGAMKYAAPARRQLGIKTIMNLLGPLANPAEAEYQLIGVYAPELCDKEARAAKLLGVKRVMVVHGLDGIDEISVSAPTKIVEIGEDGHLRDYLFNPEEIGLPLYRLSDLTGGDARENAAQAMELLEGRGRPAVRDAVLLNAGAALAVAGKATSIKGGYQLAAEALRSGRVLKKLNQIKMVSSGFGAVAERSA